MCSRLSRVRPPIVTPLPQWTHGYYLRATTTYIDPISNTDNNFNEDVNGDRDTVDSRITSTGNDREGLTPENPSLRTVSLVTKNAVRRPITGATIPNFVDSAGDTITSLTRQVQENTDLTTPVESAGSVSVKIDEPGVTLLWTVSGVHADNFSISHTEVDGVEDTSVGNIDVIQVDANGKTAPEFDFDDSSKPNPYRIRLNVRVQGGETNQTSDIDVAIHVTNIDEDITIVHVDADEPNASVPAAAAPPVENATDAYAVSYDEIIDASISASQAPAVATFAANDPEGSGILWDVKGADAPLFTITGGVLKFVETPDFEDPQDRVAETGATPTVNDYLMTTPDADAGMNTYDVVVRAIEDRTDRPAAERSWPAQTIERHVRVTVDNVDEPGVITLQWRQPELGTPIMAILRDADGPASGSAIVVSTWEWKISNAGIVPPTLNKDNNNHWRMALGDGNATQTYTPEDAPEQPGGGDVVDSGRYLWLKATYTDGETEAGDDPKMAIGVSEMTVQAAGLGEVDGSPNFQRDLEEISVGENTPSVGTLLGTVAVRQGGTEAGDTLTYSFRDVVVGDLTTAVVTALGADATTRITAAINNGDWADDEFFTINRANGQVRLAQPLDFESRPPGGKYIVVVRAADPSVHLTPVPLTNLDDVVVIITATDENDAPKLTGRAELTIDENAAVNAFEGNTTAILEAIEAVIDGTATQDERDTEATAVNRYTFSDPDAQDGFKQWNLTGPDGDSFRLVQTVGRLLEFKESPDYENPADADGDNVYKVTMWTIDNDGARFELDICVTVQNINEAGKVTLYDSNDMELVQPYEDQTVRAEVTDPDGGFRLRHEVVQVVDSWEWQRHQNPPAAQDENAWGVPVGTRSLYTPDADDIGWFLRATAMYKDNAPDLAPDGDVPDRPVHDNGVYTERAVTKHAVLQVDQNRSPAFPVESVTRFIAENSPTTTYVDVPLPLAIDPDGGVLTYELTDDNDGLFQLVMVRAVDVDNVAGQRAPADDGTELPMKGMTPVLQIRVAPLVAEADDVAANFGTEFDYEEVDLNSYSVEITVSDDGDHTDTLTVNIMVSGRNEAPAEPEAVPADPAGPSISGEGSVDVEEGHTGMVATYTVVNSNAAATWTLTGDDRSAFNIGRSDGMLTFNAMPDFENPADAGTNNTYEITVNAAIAGGDPLSLDVTVNVTNEDDPGTVSLSSTTPRVGVAITASVDDPDGGVTGATWEWARSSDGLTGWVDTGATSAAYTPVAADADNYLRATAVSYTDDEGSGKSAEPAVSANAVLDTTAPTTGSALGDTYDTNDDGEIERDEVLGAIVDFVGGDLNRDDVLSIILLFVTS